MQNLLFLLSLYRLKTMLNYQNYWWKDLRPVYWNKYKIIPKETYDENDNVRELLDSSYRGVKRLFVLGYIDQGGANRVTADSQRRYFFPRAKIEN